MYIDIFKNAITIETKVAFSFLRVISHLGNCFWYWIFNMLNLPVLSHVCSCYFHSDSPTVVLDIRLWWAWELVHSEGFQVFLMWILGWEPLLYIRVQPPDYVTSAKVTESWYLRPEIYSFIQQCIYWVSILRQALFWVCKTHEWMKEI